MADVKLEVRPRALLGKKARFLRRAGITPANLYGAEIESIALQVDTRALIQTITSTSRNTPVDLNVIGESTPRTAFVWRVQRHPLTEELLHVDFYHVEATRTMRAQVPIVLENVNPELEKLSKRVTQYLESVEVETLPADLPTQILVDGSKLAEIDDQLVVAQLRVPDKVTVLSDSEQLVARVTEIVTIKDADEAADEDAAGPVGGAAPTEATADEDEKS
jgi:large subunit ribosomal protein L25